MNDDTIDPARLIMREGADKKTLSEIVREIVADVVDAAECNYALYPRSMQPLANQLREILAGKDISRIEASIGRR